MGLSEGAPTQGGGGGWWGVGGGGGGGGGGDNLRHHIPQGQPYPNPETQSD